MINQDQSCAELERDEDRPILRRHEHYRLKMPDPNLGNVLALFKKWLKSKLFSTLDDET